MIKKWIYGVAAGITALLWLVINIRVEAGVAAPFEKALDGLVGGILVLLVVFGAVSFFGSSKK